MSGATSGRAGVTAAGALLALALVASGCVSKAGVMRRLERGDMDGPELAKWAQHEDPEIRAAVAGYCGSAQYLCQSLVRAALDDREGSVRRVAMAGLAEACSGPGRALLAARAAQAPRSPGLGEAVAACPSGDARLALMQAGVPVPGSREPLRLPDPVLAQWEVLETLRAYPTPRDRVARLADRLRPEVDRIRRMEAQEAQVQAHLAAGRWAEALELALGRDWAPEARGERVRTAVREALLVETARCDRLIDVGALEEAEAVLASLAGVVEVAPLQGRLREARHGRLLASAEAALEAEEWPEARAALAEAATLGVDEEAVNALLGRVVAAEWEALAAGDPTAEEVAAFVADTPEALVPEAALTLRDALAREAARQAWLEESTELDPHWVIAVLQGRVVDVFDLADEYDTPLQRKVFRGTDEYARLEALLKTVQQDVRTKQWYVSLAGWSECPEWPDVSNYDLEAKGLWVCVGAFYGRGEALEHPGLRMQAGRVLVRASEAEGLRVEQAREVRTVLRFGISGLSRDTWSDYEAGAYPRIRTKARVVEIQDAETGEVLVRRSI